MPVVFHILRSQ